MSTPGRAYDLLRAYVNDTYERIFVPGDDGAARAEFDRELAATLPPVPRMAAKVEAPMTLDDARRILGVKPDAAFGEIRRERERLLERCDPERFAKGSDERRRAANVRTKVEAAYLALREAADATDRRFGTLEIE